MKKYTEPLKKMKVKSKQGAEIKSSGKKSGNLKAKQGANIGVMGR